MKRKTLPNGRSKGYEPFILHFSWFTKCAAWKALPPVAKCLEMELKALHNGYNNGELFLSVREAAKRLGVAPNTAVKAFTELQEKGFIISNQKGGFAFKLRHATSWILTEFDYKNAPASKEFMRWPLKKNPVLKTDTVSIKN